MKHLLAGLALTGLGVWGIVAWWDVFGLVMRGVVPFGLLVVGLIAIMAGYRKGSTASQPQTGGTKGPLDFAGPSPDASGPAMPSTELGRAKP